MLLSWMDVATGTLLTTRINCTLWHETDAYLGTPSPAKTALGLEKFYSGIFSAMITIFTFIEQKDKDATSCTAKGNFESCYKSYHFPFYLDEKQSKVYMFSKAT